MTTLQRPHSCSFESASCCEIIGALAGIIDTRMIWFAVALFWECVSELDDGPGHPCRTAQVPQLEKETRAEDRPLFSRLGIDVLSFTRIPAIGHPSSASTHQYLQKTQAVIKGAALAFHAGRAWAAPGVCHWRWTVTLPVSLCQTQAPEEGTRRSAIARVGLGSDVAGSGPGPRGPHQATVH